MSTTYQPELWRDLFEMLGGAAAALIGLLFVATSLQLDHIMKNPVFRWRARNNLFYLTTMVVMSALILIPQPASFLGAELAAINIFWSRNALGAIYKHHVLKKDLGGLSLRRAWIYTSVYAVGTLGGGLLISGSGSGMYFVAIGYIALLCVVVMNAWEIMLGAWNAQKQPSGKQKRRAA